MTIEIQGEILFKGITAIDGLWGAVTPWIRRRADRAIFAVQILVVQGVTLTWNVEHKNLADAESAATDVMVSNLTSNTVQVQKSTLQVDLKELVRFKFATGTPASVSDFVHFRPLNIQWHDDHDSVLPEMYPTL